MRYLLIRYDIIVGQTERFFWCNNEIRVGGTCMYVKEEKSVESCVLFLRGGQKIPKNVPVRLMDLPSPTGISPYLQYISSYFYILSTYFFIFSTCFGVPSTRGGGRSAKFHIYVYGKNIEILLQVPEPLE